MNYELPTPIHANVERRSLFAIHDVTICEFFTLINLKLREFNNLDSLVERNLHFRGWGAVAGCDQNPLSV